jgi:hypothetical protein
VLIARLASGGHGPEPEAQGLSFAFEVGVRHFCRPDIEQIQDARLMLWRMFVEESAGDRDIATADGMSSLCYGFSGKPSSFTLIPTSLRRPIGLLLWPHERVEGRLRPFLNDGVVPPIRRPQGNDFPCTHLVNRFDLDRFSLYKITALNP